MIFTLRNKVLSPSRNVMFTLPRYEVLNVTGISSIRAEASIHRSINTKQWNKEKGTAYPVSVYAKKLNRYFEQQRNQVYLKQEELISKNKVVTARSLKNAYIGKDNE